VLTDILGGFIFFTGVVQQQALLVVFFMYVSGVN